MDIGTHISKSKQFYSSLRSFFDIDVNKNKPAQLFSGSPKYWRRPGITHIDVDLTNSFVKKYDLSVFIHSIYLINLCQPVEVFKKKAFECLKWELRAGLLLGFKGIVVHCGKSLKFPLEEALNNMYTNICSVFKYVSPTCPLLLETSSGQGTETLSTFDAFSQFYQRFTKEQQQLIKICIDTCHIFAAGHEPIQYLKKWDIQHPTSLVLVHFNDSKEECGKKKDRHAFPGEGWIGPEKMCIIEGWCRDKKIPMVLEV
jgi:deoxyribonuclease-4